MTRRSARTVYVSVAFATITFLACGVPSAEAQPPIPPGLADPRPDPLLLMPLVTTHTQLWVAGIVHTRPSVVDAADYAVGGRLTLFPPVGPALSFGVEFQTVSNKLTPLRTGFTGTIQTSALIGDVPANTGAILTLDCTNCPRGSRLSAGVYVEEIPLGQGASFARYFAGVIDPKIDGVLDPRVDGVIDPKVDSVIDPMADGVAMMPVVTTFTRLRITGVAHARRPFRDPDTLGLIGDTPTIRGRLTLLLPDGTSRFFDITLRAIEEKDMPHRVGFSGVVSLNLIGEVPTNTGASLAFDCVNCPGGAVINAGMHLEDVSAAPSPSFMPYLVSLAALVADPTNPRK